VADLTVTYTYTGAADSFTVPAIPSGATQWDYTVNVVGGAGANPAGGGVGFQTTYPINGSWLAGDVGTVIPLRVGGGASGRTGGWPDGGNGGTSVLQGDGGGGGGSSMFGTAIAGGTGGASGYLSDPYYAPTPYTLSMYDVLPPSYGWSGIYAWSYAQGCNACSPAFGGPGFGGPGGATLARMPSMDAGWSNTLNWPGPFNPALWFHLPPLAAPNWPAVAASPLFSVGWTAGALFNVGSAPLEYPDGVLGGDGQNYAAGGQGGDGADGYAAPGGGGGGGGLGGGGGGGSSSATTVADIFTYPPGWVDIYPSTYGTYRTWAGWFGPGGNGGTTDKIPSIPYVNTVTPAGVDGIIIIELTAPGAEPVATAGWRVGQLGLGPFW